MKNKHHEFEKTERPSSPGPPERPSDAGVACLGQQERDPVARRWAMFCHLGGLGVVLCPVNIILPAVIWVKKKSEHNFVDGQGRAAVEFQICVSLLLAASTWVSVVPYAGGVLMWVLAGVVGVLDIVFVLIGAIKAAEGRHYQYPVCAKLTKSRAMGLDFIVSITLVVLYIQITGSMLLSGPNEDTYFGAVASMGVLGVAYLVFRALRGCAPLRGLITGALLAGVVVVVPTLLLASGGGEHEVTVVLAGLLLVTVPPTAAFGAGSSWLVRWWQRQEALPVSEEAPKGIGGWLTLPAIGLIGSLVMLVVSIALDIDNPAVSGDVAGFMIAAKVGLLCACALVTYCFFGKKRRAPKFFVAWMFLVTAYYLVSALVYTLLSVQLARLALGILLFKVLPWVVACLIWTPYFAKSQRVRATFQR